MKTFLTLVTLLLFSYTNASVAQEKPPLVGVGSDSIGQQAAAKKSYEQWVFGFMSSLALVHSQPVFDLSKPNEIWLAIETICKKNPEQHVFEAASVVYLQLLKMLSKTMK